MGTAYNAEVSLYWTAKVSIEVMVSDPHLMAENCYAMAYFMIPRTLFDDKERIIKDLLSGDRHEAFKYYFFTCRMRKVEPDPELIDSFSVSVGEIENEFRYYIIEYPTPPSVDLLSKPDGARLAAMPILAPYFSAIIERIPGKEVEYYILGQSPAGHTTLRSVTPDANANMGRGCEPRLDLFVSLLKNRLAKA